MSETIFIDPNKVDEYATEIETLGKNMKAKMDEVDAKVKSLSADWQDDAQVDYAAKFEKLAADFQDLEKLIPAYANGAHSHAEEMRKIGLGK